MWRLMALPILLIVVLLAGDRALERKAWAAEAIELSQDDRATLEKFLGKGVVGKAVPGNPIADATKFFAFEDGAWNFQFTSGDHKGKTQEQSFKKLKRDDSGTAGRYQNGPNMTYFLHRAEDGSISIGSEQDADQGVITRFSPPEPFYFGGMKQGDSKQTKIEVKVYDLSDPKDVTHSGSLDLTYSYIGAYEVTVPAGKFEAALIKWDYKGEVGPASIEDTQYRFLAEGAGVVAMVEKKNISAVLIYHDRTKYGKVLVGNK
jgi:hypothetical protein